MSGAPGPTIRLDGISYAYPGGKAGVFDIDLDIAPGELVAVIGASGSGKSTLLRIIAGFIRPDRGRVLLDGADVTQAPPRARDLGIVFQTYALFAHMTARENVAYPLKVRGIARRERLERAGEMLAQVGLAGQADRRPAQLSGGQQQRVALARALVFRPRALLLDEPLSALDAALRLEMRDEIRALQRTKGIATLHITHDQEEALSMADRVAVLAQGRMLQVAPPRTLYERPASRAVAAFVGHANLWDGTADGPDAVRLPVGRLRTAPHGRASGAPVAVLVRPQNVAVGPGAAGANELRGTLQRDRYLGAIRRFDMAVAGGIIVGETPAEGDVSVVNVPPEHVVVLPDETGAKESTTTSR